MVEIVHIRTRNNRPTVPCELRDLEVRVGAHLIVDIDDEKECGRVATKPVTMERDDLPEVYGICLSKATPEDLEQLEKNRAREQEAYRTCQDRLRTHNLDMKLVAVECLFDRSKLKFYYTSEGRIDFRDLVKDLAQTFRTRIEMRQVGVRDQAAMVGGFGHCGLTLCCSTFLRGFAPITIKMAKDQNLALNPTKISGQCGRLLCCLRYEFEHYHEARRKFPKMNARVRVKQGDGNVIGLNILKEQVTVRLETETLAIPLAEIQVIPKTGMEPRRPAPDARPPRRDSDDRSDGVPAGLAELDEGGEPRRPADRDRDRDRDRGRDRLAGRGGLRGPDRDRPRDSGRDGGRDGGRERGRDGGRDHDGGSRDGGRDRNRRRRNRPQGDRPQGDRPQGDRPQGDRPQGDRPQGDRPPVDRREGPSQPDAGAGPAN